MPHPVSHLLARRHRRRRWLAAAAAACLGLVATLAAVWALNPGLRWPGNSTRLESIWLAGLASTALVAAGAAVLGGRRRDPLRTAATLDDALESKNRLEAAAHLRGDGGALAEAQRHETAVFLEKKDARMLRPGIDLVAWLAGAAALLLLFHAATFTAWRFAAPAAAAPQGPGPEAQIVWRSPKSEAKASPIEEVPLRAEAASSSGLRNLRLEVQVNGESRKPVPVPEDAARALAKPGKAGIALPLDLDELGVEAYDMVSYYLAGTRISRQPLAETASPVQFIQVRPFQDDAAQEPGGDGKGLFPLLTALKSAQLRALKENFTLLHADVARDSAAWKEENARVGGEQATLARKTSEAIEKFIQEGAPAQMVYLLQQAHDEMPPAGESILGGKNAEALPRQGKALADLTEIEKYFRKVLLDGGKSTGDAKNVPDPFKDPQKIELSKRQNTAAGMLEKLAREQARLAGDLSGRKPDAPLSPAPASSAPVADPGGPAPANPPEIKPGVEAETFEGTPSQRQTLVGQGIDALLNGKQLPDAVGAHLEKAHAQALASLKQLDAADPGGAREPAAAAAASLQAALDEMNRQGKEQAKKDLAAAQQALNDAAQKASLSGAPGDKGDKAQDAAQKATAAQQKLQDAAERQQQTGAGDQAQKLKDMADAIAASQVRKDLLDLHNAAAGAANAGDVQAKAAAAAGRLQELAAEAARKAQDGPPQGAQLSQLLEGLERSRAALARLAAADAHAGPQPGKDGAPAPQPGAGQTPAPSPGQAAGKSPGAGQGPAPAPAPGQGEGPGPGDGTDGKPGDGSASSDPQGNGPGSDPRGQGGGNNPSDDPTAPHAGQGQGRGLARLSPAERQEMARQVQDALRNQVQQAAAVLDGKPQDAHAASVAGAVASLRRDLKPQGTYAPAVVPYQKIAPPLDDLIRWVQGELAKASRQQVLQVDDPAQAPASYRDAVADYFEQLSKDYDRPPPAQPAPPSQP